MARGGGYAGSIAERHSAGNAGGKESDLAVKMHRCLGNGGRRVCAHMEERGGMSALSCEVMAYGRNTKATTCQAKAPLPQP